MMRKGSNILKGYWLGVWFVMLCVGGCMHKSPETGSADDILKALICSDKAGGILVTMENIFQAVSKSSDGGFTHISGYEEERLSSYDLSQGTLLGRQVFGKMAKNGGRLLGYSAGLIWIYSIDAELGLHARNARTLSLRISENQIIEKNSFLKGNLSRPEVYRIGDFYSYDDLMDRIVLTDTKGYRYALEPDSLAALKLPQKFRMTDLRDKTDYFSEYSQFEGKRMSLDGEMRKTVMVDNRMIDAGISFLQGKFIQDQNRPRILNQARSLRQRLENELRESQQKQPPMSDKRNKLNEISRSVESMETERIFSSPLGQLLQPDHETFFVAHRSSTERDARLLITCLRMRGASGLQKLWSTTLDNLFYDISAARETDAFKIVFSKGNPSFDFQFVDMTSDKLVIIYMLYAYCLDLKKGNVLWFFRF